MYVSFVQLLCLLLDQVVCCEACWCGVDTNVWSMVFPHFRITNVLMYTQSRQLDTLRNAESQSGAQAWMWPCAACGPCDVFAVD